MPTASTRSTTSPGPGGGGSGMSWNSSPKAAAVLRSASIRRAPDSGRHRRRSAAWRPGRSPCRSASGGRRPAPAPARRGSRRCAPCRTPSTPQARAMAAWSTAVKFDRLGVLAEFHLLGVLLVAEDAVVQDDQRRSAAPAAAASPARPRNGRSRHRRRGRRPGAGPALPRSARRSPSAGPSRGRRGRAASGSAGRRAWRSGSWRSRSRNSWHRRRRCPPAVSTRVELGHQPLRPQQLRVAGGDVGDGAAPAGDGRGDLGLERRPRGRAALARSRPASAVGQRGQRQLGVADQPHAPRSCGRPPSDRCRGG